MEALELEKEIQANTGESKKLILRSLFRILTPSEISDLSTLVNHSPKVPLTSIVEKDLANKKKSKKKIAKRETKAKILPFKNKLKIVSSEEETIEPELEKLEDENLEGESLIFKKEKVVVQKKIDRVKFILEQRENFREHSYNLKKNDILKAYDKEASYSVCKQSDQGSVKKQTSQGILINKKCS